MVKKTVNPAVLMIFLLPILIIAMICLYVSPQGFWETLAMFLVGVLLYPIILILEIIIIVSVST